MSADVFCCFLVDVLGRLSVELKIKPLQYFLRVIWSPDRGAFVYSEYVRIPETCTEEWFRGLVTGVLWQAAIWGISEPQPACETCKCFILFACLKINQKVLWFWWTVIGLVEQSYCRVGKSWLPGKVAFFLVNASLSGCFLQRKCVFVATRKKFPELCWCQRSAANAWDNAVLSVASWQIHGGLNTQMI